jgi:hypothetical protein
MRHLVAIMAVFIMGCGNLVSDQRVISAVEKQGYTNIQIVKKHILFPDYCGCGEGDDAAYDMIATNALGKSVDLIACAGITKGVTVRTK